MKKAYVIKVWFTAESTEPEYFTSSYQTADESKRIIASYSKMIGAAKRFRTKKEMRCASNELKETFRYTAIIQDETIYF